MGGRLKLKAALIFFIITVFSFTTADDATVMSKLLAAISPTPKGWSATTDFCTWKYVICDNSSRVATISLASLSLSGTLPSDLGSLTHLNFLSLERNSFSGPIPSLSNLPFIKFINLETNRFTSIPTNFFQGLTSLQIFRLGNNPSLQPWTIPTDLTQATSLSIFSAANARVFGSLPDIFGSFPNFIRLRLSYNNLTGPIPDLSNCTKLVNLVLNDNQFTGLLPPSLFSMSSLRIISLANNLLQGPYPEFPSNVTRVTVNGTNSFCKSIPGSCDPLVTILLEVASSLGYPIKLANSWRGNDACKNWNYITCDSQGNIITVNLTKQQFGGTISPAFANLTSLRNLYLNDNNLTGSIPDSLARMPNLQTLDVSNNNLNGAIPKFASTLKLISTGNPSLGTTPSSGSGGSGGTPSGSDSNSTTPGESPAGMPSNGNSVSPGMIAGVVIAVVIFVVVVLFVLIKCYVNKRHRKVGRVESRENGGVPSELQSHIEGGNVAISIQVLRQVTNNFSEDNILGRGGFGVVYKGELHDGTKIAVKRMESVAIRTRGMNEFQAEIAVLTKVRHRRLVALLGYCINGNERLLVYEYMPQGTLKQHLFDWHESGSPPLTWKQRVTIALDVGRGVEYLHSSAQQSFIHRDLKPSNILLGDDMRAKVADFGLVKNAPDGNYSMETRVAGTFGYLAPEYAATGRVTTKVDVYAFGVILMQLITGRKALDDDILPDDLATWFHRVLINKENISKAIDQTIHPDEETMESIYKVAELARHCTAREPHQRPDMGHIVNILSPLVELWKPISHEEDMISLPQDLQSCRANEGNE